VLQSNPLFNSGGSGSIGGGGACTTTSSSYSYSLVEDSSLDSLPGGQENSPLFLLSPPDSVQPRSNTQACLLADLEGSGAVLAPFRRQLLNPLVLSALAGLERYDRHPLFPGTIASTIAGELCCSVRDTRGLQGGCSTHLTHRAPANRGR